MLLLAALAVAGLVTGLGAVWFLRSVGWKRVTWGLSHHATLWDCRKSTRARGATAAQADTYCGCMLDTIARRWTLDEYRFRQREAMVELEADGTVDRCSSGSVAPAANSLERAEWNRLTWAPWRTEHVSACTKRRAVAGRTVEQAAAYCRCMTDVLESRWSASEYRRNSADVLLALDREGKREECWTSAGVAPAPPFP